MPEFVNEHTEEILKAVIAACGDKTLSDEGGGAVTAWSEYPPRTEIVNEKWSDEVVVGDGSNGVTCGKSLVARILQGRHLLRDGAEDEVVAARVVMLIDKLSAADESGFTSIFCKP